MFRALSAAAIGSGVGSVLLGVWCATWGGIYANGHSLIFAIASGFAVFGFMSAVCSFLPVLVVTAILGPIAEKLAGKGRQFAPKLYFLVVTGIMLILGLPFGLPGIGFSILGLVMYGYPAAFAYIRLRSPS